MITQISINNFKKLENISFPFAQSVALIGPNNSGKSTVFQALCLWEIGVTNYIAAWKKRDLDGKGFVVINRKDLLNSPVSDTRFLWKNKQVTEKPAGGNSHHILLEIEIQGINDGKKWTCKSAFTFSNSESFTCRITTGLKEMAELYEKETGPRFRFLQTMSGIISSEDKLALGAIERRLGEGRTAEVLRNICYSILYPDTPQAFDTEENWNKFCKVIREMFGAELQKPEFIKSLGIIQLEYKENKITYDISSGGRGFLQTLLVLAYMYANPQTILLLDEPDAHLEVIRQREVFQRINDVANETNSQLIIASHSEVVLEEASESSKVIALIENSAIEINPKNKKHIRSALTDIGWERYYLAKLKNHILYLEGTTDLEMLICFANRLEHKVAPLLRIAHVRPTADNVPNTAVKEFVSLKEFFPELKGIALFDKIDKKLEALPLTVICWQKRELENYFAKPEILIKHAKLLANKHKHLTSEKLGKIMEDTIADLTPPIYLRDPANKWWDTEKLSDEWLDKIFPEFFKKVGLPLDFYKRDYYQLINILKKEDIDKEVVEKLDLIYETIKPN